MQIWWIEPSIVLAARRSNTVARKVENSASSHLAACPWRSCRWWMRAEPTDMAVDLHIVGRVSEHELRFGSIQQRYRRPPGRGHRRTTSGDVREATGRPRGSPRAQPRRAAPYLRARRGEVAASRASSSKMSISAVSKPVSSISTSSSISACSSIARISRSQPAFSRQFVVGKNVGALVGLA